MTQCTFKAGWESLLCLWQRERVVCVLMLRTSQPICFCLSDLPELDAMELPEEKVEEEVDEEFKLAPGEAKYRTLEQMSKDIKGLDEVCRGGN